MKILTTLAFAVFCALGFGQTYTISSSIVGGAGSTTNIGSNSHNLLPDSGLPEGAQGYMAVITSGAGGGTSYPPGSSAYSYSESIGWGVTVTVTGASNIPGYIDWSATLTDSAHATAQTFNTPGTADGDGTAGTGDAEVDAPISASGTEDNQSEYPSNTTTPFGTTIESPGFTDNGDGTYTYSWSITSDSLSTSASTSEGESATGTAWSDMVVNSVVGGH